VGSIGKVFNLSETWVGALFSVTLFSSAFGGALFGIVSDYIGRVRALTYSLFRIHGPERLFPQYNVPSRLPSHPGARYGGRMGVR
jgi:hypothetical protein